jgi:L-methionine (R)-S-oxide reductase
MSNDINYDSLLEQVEALWVGRWLTDMANTSAFIFSEFKDINWAGFYLFDGHALRLGPFHGKPACTDIEEGRGVCGKAFALLKTLRVPDVHKFDDHITCDPVSRSELVVPLLFKGRPIGVLDIDSPLVDRFTEADQKFFEKMAVALSSSSLSELV